jgi:hypothetical protein
MVAPDLTTTTIVDAVARVCAEAIGAGDHVFAAGVTLDVTTMEPMVVPLADDFSEAGLPAVTVAMGQWLPVLQPGNERLTMTLLCAVWRPRVPLEENTNALYDDRDALANAFIDHTKAFLHEPRIQSAILMGGPGIRARSIPRGTSAESARPLLTLPFTVEVKCNRPVRPQPA